MTKQRWALNSIIDTGVEENHQLDSDEVEKNNNNNKQQQQKATGVYQLNPFFPVVPSIRINWMSPFFI